MTNFEYYTTAENGSEEFTEAIKKLGCKDSRRNIIKCADILKFLQEEHIEHCPLPILTESEKAYLSNVIAPFKHDVTSISRLLLPHSMWGIKITYNKGASYLPFGENYFEGMERYKEYTLKELGL